MARWIAAEEARAGLRHAVVCPNVTERTKERIAQTKRARAGLLALVDEPQVARTCILRAFGLQMSSLFWCYACYILLSFRPCAFSLKPRPFVQSSFFDMQAPR